MMFRRSILLATRLLFVCVVEHQQIIWLEETIMGENTNVAYLAILNSPVIVRSILRQIISLDGEDAVEDNDVLIKYGLDECSESLLTQAKNSL